GGGVGVEEAVANDLADGFVGAAGGAFGAAALALQGGGAVGEKGAAELEVALLAEAELLSGGVGAEALALALDEHKELACDLVGGGDGERTGGADELLELGIEVEHGRASGGAMSPGERIGKGRAQSNEIWR